MTVRDSFGTIIEPFKIKTVEPIRMTSRDERAAFLKEAGPSSQLCTGPGKSARHPGRPRTGGAEPARSEAEF